MLLLYRRVCSYMLFHRQNLHSTMLLLYRRTDDDRNRGAFEFTFHYASTLSHTLRHTHASLLNLHSTMLLLYRLIRKTHISAVQNLHSTMLLLYLKTGQRKACAVNIYIPLCFYFIPCIRSLTMLRSFIYIPLCFYFIGNVDDSIVAEQNLHSTMLLLYLRSVQNLCWPSCIYIPLCFYFILCNRGFLPSLLKIYIPLCFYFISCSFLRVLLTHTHLHSTMLLLYHDRLSEIHDKELHLHSTMLLLYLSAGAQNQDTGKIYIPLCFYFITMSALMLSGRVQNLHSTMLLLYPIAILFTRALRNIYIPLCFYFIQLWCTDITAQVVDLHSTMLLLYRDFHPCRFSASLIYIPLCFYFIFIPCSNIRLACVIYIPLCFYFIEYLKLLFDMYFSFTFHYASTLSWNVRWWCKHWLIYIPLCFYFINDLEDRTRDTENIYIPLCFYFIGNRYLAKKKQCHIYIPLCFYFIKRRRSIPWPHSMNLHSTMLLLYPSL